jgi:hypothetical protein
VQKKLGGNVVFKVFILIFFICAILTACQSPKATNDVKAISTNVISSTAKSNINNTDPKNIQGSSNWKTVYENAIDINNDNINENIEIYTTGDSSETFEMKIQINKLEKTFKFDPEKYAIISFNKCQSVRLDNNKKGLQIILSSTTDYIDTENKNPAPWWFDRNFIIVGYESNEITTLLDGLNTQYNDINNYKRYYQGDYVVKFQDIFTKLTADIKLIDNPKNSDLSEDDIKFLIDSDENNNAGVSMNYIKIQTRDINSKGIDDIVCSKYIPGLVNKQMLGTIDYIYEFQGNEYVLTKEVLSYKDEGITPKTIEIKIN